MGCRRSVKMGSSQGSSIEGKVAINHEVYLGMYPPERIKPGTEEETSKDQFIYIYIYNKCVICYIYILYYIYM